MQAIDDVTHVPEDVYADFLAAGERVRCLCQHIPVIDRKGQRTLKHFSKVPSKSLSCANSVPSSMSSGAGGVRAQVAKIEAQVARKSRPRSTSRGRSRFDRRGAKPQHIEEPEEPEADPDFGAWDFGDPDFSPGASGSVSQRTPETVAKVARPTPLKATRHTETGRAAFAGCKGAHSALPASSAFMTSADTFFFSDRLSAALGWCQPAPLHGAPDYVRVV